MSNNINSLRGGLRGLRGGGGGGGGFLLGHSLRRLALFALQELFLKLLRGGELGEQPLVQDKSPFTFFVCNPPASTRASSAFGSVALASSNMRKIPMARYLVYRSLPA